MIQTSERPGSASGVRTLTHDRLKPAPRIPRTVASCLLIAIFLHLWEAIASIGSNRSIGTPDWLALAVAELLLLGVALSHPSMFTIRNFRITGIGVAANALLILAPLPWLMRTYESFVPTTMIYAIATGVASMAWVFLAMASWSSRPTRVLRRNPGAERLLPHERLIPIAAVALTILVVPVWIAVSGTPPLFRLLSGASSTELVMDRQASFSQLGSAPLRLVIGVLRNLLIMFASGWFIADALTTPRSAWRNRSRAELIAMAAIGIGVFFALLTTERAIVGELMVVCAIAGFIATGRTLSVRSVGALVAAAGSFTLAVGLLSGAGNLKEVIVGLGQRAFYLPT